MVATPLGDMVENDSVGTGKAIRSPNGSPCPLLPCTRCTVSFGKAWHYSCMALFMHER